MTRACNCNGAVAVYIRTTWSVLILPVFPAGLSAMIRSSKYVRQVPLHARVSIRACPRRNLSPGSRDQGLDSRRTEKETCRFVRMDVRETGESRSIPVIQASRKRRLSVPRPFLSSALLHWVQRRTSFISFASASSPPPHGLQQRWSRCCPTDF